MRSTNDESARRIDMEFDGKKLRGIRKANSLRQNELAQKAGCSRATISAAEQNSRTPQKKLIKKLAEVLKVPESDFYTISPVGHSQALSDSYEQFSDAEHRAVEAIIMFPPERRRMVIEYLAQLQADADGKPAANVADRSEGYEEKLQKVKEIINSQKVQTKILSQEDSKIMADLREALGPEPTEKQKRATS